MNFWDKLGRLHTKPVTEADPFPTNNAYIYSAYYKVLHPVTPKFYNELQLPQLLRAKPFDRHPFTQLPAVSHDEVHGVCILSLAAAQDICNYLSRNYNQYCNLNRFKPTPFYKLNWFKIIPAAIKVLRSENMRKAAINYPELDHLAFWQQPQYRWFYKRCAGITPSIFEKLAFLVARGISVFRWKKEEPNLLLFLSLLHLKQQNNLGIEGRIIQMYMNTYVNDMYDDVNDMLKHATKDLPAEYYNIHPLVTG